MVTFKSCYLAIFSYSQILTHHFFLLDAYATSSGQARWGWLAVATAFLPMLRLPTGPPGLPDSDAVALQKFGMTPVKPVVARF